MGDRLEMTEAEALAQDLAQQEALYDLWHSLDKGVTGLREVLELAAKEVPNNEQGRRLMAYSVLLKDVANYCRRAAGSVGKGH